MHTKLSRIMGMAGIGFLVATNDRPKCAKSKTLTAIAIM
jgi:hypothetical protein